MALADGVRIADSESTNAEGGAMIPAVVILVVALLVATVFLAGALRRMVLDESATEVRLLASDAASVSFVVPHGVDAADLRAAARRGGFESIVTTSGTHQCLRVPCEAADRERLRHLLEEAHDATYNGTELDLHPVVFEGELRA
jgi:outer membrane murein-binding lipoprotein Lpp